MLSVRIITTPVDLQNEFKRCCKQYKHLQIAVAWCGTSKGTPPAFPYSYINFIQGSITATIGTSFTHTHPDGIDYFIKRKTDLRLFKESGYTFHPKVFFFSTGNEIAIFIGSSNFTNSGFGANVEINTLLEGIPSSKENKQVSQLKDQLNEWHSLENYSFSPDQKWLDNYRKKFIVSVINNIGNMNKPIDWSKLNELILELCKIGPTIKVWSRLFCLVRPDIFCTVASPSVRKNLASTLKWTQSSFATPEKYVLLHKLIHVSPWFNSERPVNTEEVKIWSRRVALMDILLHE